MKYDLITLHNTFTYLNNIQLAVNQITSFLRKHPDQLYKFKFDREAFEDAGTSVTDFYNDLVDALENEGEYDGVKYSIGSIVDDLTDKSDFNYIYSVELMDKNNKDLIEDTEDNIGLDPTEINDEYEDDGYDSEQFDLPDDEELYIREDDDYYLTQSMKPNENNLYRYNVYDYNDIKVATWLSRHNAAGMTIGEFKDSIVYSLYKREIENAKARNNKGLRDLSKGVSTPPTNYYHKKTNYKQISWDDYLNKDEDSDDNDWPSFSSYSYRIPEKAKGLAKDLKKSDTLVIHGQDRSTEMLGQIYAGKGWDVLRNGNIDKDELHELLECHDKIIMLGHGTSGGLINPQGGGYTIGDAEAPFLKDKKLFVIWCNADKFFTKHHIGDGQFITKNAPSEVWESRAAGCGNISSELMLDNITYWSKLCADIVDQCLEGNVDTGVDYLRKEYLEKYGNHPVTLFNADSAHKLGVNKELPKYEFKGEPLTEKDYPVPNFDEEAFLKNPTAEASKCPKKDKKAEE